MAPPMTGNTSATALIGTWRLKSYVATTYSGESSRPYGAFPSGYLSYSADGRMQVIGTADGRSAPPQSTDSDEHLATLQRTLFAYAGSYSVEDDKVIHHVEVSWNQEWNGTDQVRCFALVGNTLTL